VSAGHEPQVRIRKARARDLDAIDALEAASFTVDRFSRRTFARLLKSSSAEFLIAEVEGAPLGYILLLYREGARAARLYSLAAAPAARGRGVGTSLVQAGAQCAIERGCSRLRLEVRASNRSAISLYERTGFLTVDKLPGYYTDGATALRMELRLDEGRASEPR
jgi:ribosomal protein S18 acetylase RimI-like enzyme